MDDLIKINYNSDQPTVSARELHDFLEVGAAYKDWFPRMRNGIRNMLKTTRKVLYWN